MKLGKVTLIVGIVLAGLFVAASFAGAQQAKTQRSQADIKLDFKLFPVGDRSPRLQSSASGREEGADASAGAALDAAARTVIAAVKKRGISSIL